MKTRSSTYSVKDLVELRRAGLVKANPEYQRGVVWKPHQQKRLIDSVMRGYQLPIIYLHHINRIVAGIKDERFEIIDGQQRIEALYLFAEGAFPLYKIGDADGKFPKFLQEQTSPWEGLTFYEMNEELISIFMDAKLPIAFIETEDDNEIRDLFVRLQAGFPLNPQEKRDSYPGQFTDFILRVGGKPEIARYPGNDFFRSVLNMKPEQDRGKTRQLAAQIVILLLERRAKGSDYFSDINAQAVDDYYYTHLDFDSTNPVCRRLTDILAKLTALLGTGKRPPLRAHDAIHMVLFLDSIWDDYTKSWESSFAAAQDQFSAALSKATKEKDAPQPDPYWLQYGVRARTNSDRGESIRLRHQFYSMRMKEFLGDSLVLKDSNRAFGPLERQIVYWRDRKRCQVCGSEVLWDEAEIHHVIEYHQGGKTELSNAALVHKHDHPKGQAAIEFAKKWKAHSEIQSQAISL